MRPLLALLLLLQAGIFVEAQVPGSPVASSAVQKFEGTESQTTPPFPMTDRWEIRWSAPGDMNISVLAEDGTVIAGASGIQGALYIPRPGTFRLQLDFTPRLSMMPSNVINRPAPTPFQSTVNGGTTQDNSNPAPTSPTPPAFRPKYFVEVLYLTAASAGGRMANYTLPGTPAPAAPTTPMAAPIVAPNLPAPPTIYTPGGPAPGVSTAMTSDQARAVVLIKGDNAEGTGFIIKTPTGPAVVTNIHVIADNPNLKITTNTGALVTTTGQKCASDRDLALLAVQDNPAAPYAVLEMAPDISAVVQPGDVVITPGNSQGGEVMLNTNGTVKGIGPERIEIDNPIYHGNSGGPVFHPKSGKVLGVVTEAMKVDMSNDLDKTSFASRNSAISGNMRYFALRLDTVVQWVDVEPRAFRVETLFLDQFQEQSRRLDSYLNSPSNGNNPNASQDSDAAKIYLSDEKIMRAEHNYQSEATGGDTAQHLQALRSLLFDLQGVADTNVTQIQNMNNFYTFDRAKAREEMDYRKALKDELDSLGNNIERLGHLPRSNN